MRIICCAFALLFGFARLVWAIEPFTIEDIRVEGLQRISAGTVFNYLPLQVGDRFDDQRSAQAVRSLFKTGFFKDVRLEQEGNVLVVVVDERPSIASIDISGNKDIETEQLMEGLKRVGLSEGRTFNRSLLEKVEQELRRQYFNQGKYAVKLDTTVTPLERNRVAIKLDISEGRIAKIRQINIVGNEVFSDKTLLGEFQLTTPTTFSFYTNNDQYSKQKLSADLETLRAYYLDRGYLNFDISSTQVSISPDKKFVYITVNVREGEQYKVKDVKLAGQLVLPASEMEKLIKVVPGSVYSRTLISDSTSAIVDRLGNEGYAFANVNTAPEVDEQNKTVGLTFFVDPGRRVYVRRINFKGNVRTGDEVLRREMRQFEGGWFSTEKVNRSRTRLERLGYFTEVNVETPAVPGTNDQVDVNFTVVERPSGNLLASVGYSQTGGVLFSASVEQNNFLGTGKRISVSANESDIVTGFKVSYTNPYYTDDGVSRSFTFGSQKTDAAEANLSDYSLDTDELSVNYGIPINEYDTIHLSGGLERNAVNCSSFTPPLVCTDFVAAQGTDEFDTVKLGASYAHDTRNRAIFADQGVLHHLSGEVATGDLEYYRVRYRHERYFPVSKKLTVLLRGELGYADGYGDTGTLPFFENFFAGGPRSVRGFKANSLGPRDPATNRPIGGSVKVSGGADLYFPVPFVRDSKQFRVGLFLDVGNVYADVESFEVDELRYSTGLSTVWMSPIGPLALSVAKPLNEKSGDDTEILQFTLGGAFY